jgi:protein-disulfide isomerase
MYFLEDLKRWDEIKDSERIEIWVAAGIDEKEFTQCLTNKIYSFKIDSDKKEGEALWILGTPSIYLNWKIMQFSTTDEFFWVIDSLLKVEVESETGSEQTITSKTTTEIY